MGGRRQCQCDHVEIIPLLYNHFLFNLNYYAMRKVFLFSVAALSVLAACNKVQEVQRETVQPTAAGEVPVGFGAYSNRGIATKAGSVSSIDLNALRGDEGFGVFAYYTDANEYDPQSIPNFMYNQQVKWDGSSKWTYEPVKYWPNEYGDTAISDDADKVTYFAYAPYVEVVPSTGKLTADADDQKWGIAGLSRNSAAGDPLVKYIASFDEAKSVDLLWGVVNPSADEAWDLVNGGSQTMSKGLPWLNVERPHGVDQSLKFYFQHATAQLNVQIDADPDITVHDETTPIADGTKVYVRSVTFTGLATKGALNLNNTTSAKAEWLDYNGTNDLESGETVTIYDGRKDGKEGTLGGVASNEKILGLNAAIISNDGNTTSGVTIVPQNLFTGTVESTPIYVIPTGEEVEVEIVYDIETSDSNLSGYLSDGSTPGSSIENRIRKKVYFAGVSKFENGKSYIIKLHLGMNSVKFDADVTAWVDAESEANPWLPANITMYAAGTTNTVSVAAGASSIEDFAINGLKSGATLTITNVLPVSGSSLSVTSVPTDGQVLVQSTTITPNTTTSKVEIPDAIKVEQDNPALVTSITLVQQAAALGLSVNSYSSSTLNLGATAIDVTDLTASGITLTVKLSGVEQTVSTDYSVSGMAITFNTAPSTDAVISVTVKANDAEAETVEHTVA